MCLPSGLLVILVKILWRSVDAYTDTSMEKLMETYAGNRTLSNGEMFVMGNYYCPLLLLIIWISSIGILICTCWYCKFVRSETVTTFDSSSYELQEVSIVQHLKGCTCLDCLHRQLNQELELKTMK